MDKAQAREDLQKLWGLPPHNIPSNHCWGDGYFAASIRTKYGVEIQELAKLVGIQR